MSVVDYIWNPRESFCAITFGCLISEVKLPMKKLPPSYEGADWCTYEVEGAGIRVSDDGEDHVQYIESWEKVFLDGQNLIGLTVSEVENLTDVKFVSEDEDGCEYCNDELGVTLWLEDGIIESMTIGGSDRP